MKYHFVYETTNGDKILEYDTDLEPPQTGDTIQLPIVPDKKDTKPFHVKEVYFAPESQIRTNIVIEVEPA